MARPVFNICEWPASLYDNKKRRWYSGNLKVMAEEIVFSQQNDRGKDDDLICIPYEDLIDIRKSTTGLVFGAIFIVTKQNEKIWFSSLPDRESVYGTLKHFWQAKLFQKSNCAMKTSKGQRTKLGQTLLRLVKDSEQTLSDAAVQLYDQGKQIDHTLDVMTDLHNDLDIADNFVKDIDGWIGRWRLPEEYKTVDPVVVNKCDIPEVFEYEVLYTKLEKDHANTRQVGSLRVSKDGLTILNMKMKTEFHFRWADVSKLRVVTPWELMVIRYQIGKPDLVYGLISANMVAILRLLDNCAKYKLTYDTPPEPILCTKHPQSSGGKDSLYNAETQGSTVKEGEGPVNLTRLMGFDQIQIDQSQQVVSESEADEISRTLGGLKSLALAVQEESSVQNENLDSLTSAVDKANQRLKTADKKIKKMT